MFNEKRTKIKIFCSVVMIELVFFGILGITKSFQDYIESTNMQKACLLLDQEEILPESMEYQNCKLNQ